MYYNPDYINWNQRYGWTCPICNRVFSPTTDQCPYCNNKKITYSTKTYFNPEWIYREDTTTGSYHPDTVQTTNTTLDDFLRREYYDDEDLWGKPL